MDIPQLLSIFVALLFLALLLYPIAKGLHIPYATLLAVAGIVGSFSLTEFGIDTGIRWHHFHQLVFYVLLPILIFEASLRLKVDYFFENIVSILLLSIPFMLISTGIISVILFYGIGYPAAFPAIIALLTAAILSATDPSALLPILKRLKVPPKVIAVLQGEGLISGAMAIALVTLIYASIDRGESLTAVEVMIGYALSFTGGVFIGMLMGLLAWLLLRFIKEPVLRGIITLVAVYASFLLAESVVNVSGILAVVFVGLMINAYTQKAEEPTVGLLHDVWEYKAGIASAILFLLLGVSIQLSLLADQWIAILLGIGATLIARLVVVFLGLKLSTVLPGKEAFDYKEQTLVLWGGLRGAVTIALVLSLPSTLPAYPTIQAIVTGVVLFALFVQAPSLSLINRFMTKESSV